jgi:hypothetical protein
MGQKSDTIYSESIRYFLAVERKVIVSGSDTIPDDFSVPPDFDFKQAPPRFQQKVFKKMLENFIRTFEEADLQALPDDAIRDIKDGLNTVKSGFISLKENDNPDKDFKIELTAVNKDLRAVNEPLKKALAYMSAAISEFEDNGGKKTFEYNFALENCRDVMSDIKMDLRAWPE